MYTQEMLDKLQGMQAFLNWVLQCCIITDELAMFRGTKHSTSEIQVWQENFHTRACSFYIIGQ